MVPRKQDTARPRLISHPGAAVGWRTSARPVERPDSWKEAMRRRFPADARRSLAHARICRSSSASVMCLPFNDTLCAPQHSSAPAAGIVTSPCRTADAEVSAQLRHGHKPVYRIHVLRCTPACECLTLLLQEMQCRTCRQAETKPHRLPQPGSWSCKKQQAWGIAE